MSYLSGFKRASLQKILIPPTNTPQKKPPQNPPQKNKKPNPNKKKNKKKPHHQTQTNKES